MNKLFLAAAIAATFISQNAFAQSGYVHDAVREKEYKEHGADGEDKLNGWLGNLTNVKVARNYTFPMHLKIHTKTYGRKGKVKDEGDIDAYMNPTKTTSAVRVYEEKHGEQRPNMFSIYDYKNNSSLVFDLKHNTYMAFNLNAFMSKENQTRRETGNARVNEHIECKKTGQKKTILGYSCAQFICTDDVRGERHEMWIATQLPYTVSDALARTLRQRYTGNTQSMNGAVMEEHDYKDDELIREMMITEIVPKDNYTFPTQDFKYNGIGKVHLDD